MQRIRRPASVITAFAFTLESARVAPSLLPKLCRLNVEGFMAYYVVYAPDDTVTAISIFNDYAGVEE